MRDRWRPLRRYLAGPLAPARDAHGGRLTELDGIRGWAALGVVCYHVFWETLFFRAPEMRNIVTGALFDGGLAVSIFFVLSGEALSAPFFQGKGDAAIRALAIKRYTRLAIPVFGACALVWALAASGQMFFEKAAAFAGREHWLQGWLDFPITLAGLIKYSLLEVFYLDRPAHEWNPFLWTMGVELDGSLLVFTILLFARDMRGVKPALLVSAIVLAGAPWRATQNVSCFLVGVLFADFRARGGFAALGSPDRQKLFALALLAALIQRWRGGLRRPPRLQEPEGDRDPVLRLRHARAERVFPGADLAIPRQDFISTLSRAIPCHHRADVRGDGCRGKPRHV